MLSVLRKNAAVRINEVRSLLECIKRQESPDPMVADTHEVLILRGLYYVHLYAAFEHSVNQGVQSFLKAVTNLRVSTAHFELPLFSVALDSQLSSLGDVGEAKKWGRRLDIFNRQNSEGKCVLNDTVFGLYLQNVWIENLQQVFNCLNIPDPVIPDPRLGPYVEEIVEKRNIVAHGRESPAIVGRGTRTPELKIRLDAIAEVVQHIFDCFEKGLTTRSFIAPQHRATYLIPTAAHE